MTERVARRVMFWVGVGAMLMFFGVLAMAKPPPPIIAEGNLSCGQWTYYRINEWNKQDPGWAPNVRQMAWVAGFFTAFGIGSMFEGQIVTPAEYPSALIWIDRYCAANPASTLANAAWQLAAERMEAIAKEAGMRRIPERIPNRIPSRADDELIIK